jgi:transcriptional regulator with XRE-family HTH domain
VSTRRIPNIRARRLGTELRAIRENRGENLQAVADGLRPGWSPSKLSRYERGENYNSTEVARLLSYYRVAGDLRARLLGLAKEASEQTWWESYADVASDEYSDLIGLEADASSIEVWHVEVITGLLQTERYARAIMTAYSGVEPIAPAIIDRRVELRMQRKRVLEGRVKLLVVLDESVLKRQFGDDSIMYEQMHSLVADSARPNVTLRVLPLRTPHPVSAESFVIFNFGTKEDAILHDFVYAEGLKDSFYVEDSQETYLHRLAFNTLLEATLDPEASRAMIIHTAESYWRASP